MKMNLDNTGAVLKNFSQGKHGPRIIAYITYFHMSVVSKPFNLPQSPVYETHCKV